MSRVGRAWLSVGTSWERGAVALSSLGTVGSRRRVARARLSSLPSLLHSRLPGPLSCPFPSFPFNQVLLRGREETDSGLVRRRQEPEPLGGEGSRKVTEEWEEGAPGTGANWPFRLCWLGAPHYHSEGRGVSSWARPTCRAWPAGGAKSPAPTGGGPGHTLGRPQCPNVRGQRVAPSTGSFPAPTQA